MPFSDVIEQAQEFMQGEGLAGWLLYDYRGMNPIFWDTLGPIPHVTRPCWLWMPSQGASQLLVSYVDQGRFRPLGLVTAPRSGGRARGRRADRRASAARAGAT